MVDEPEWNNSDVSLDEDDDFFETGLQPLDPLQQAQNESELDEDPVEHQQTPTEPTSEEQPSTEEVTSSTVISGSSTLPATFDSPVGPAIDMPSTSTAMNFSM